MLHLSGLVVGIRVGVDGESGTVYIVDYDEEGCSDVDNLVEDYEKGDLTLL